MADGKRFYVRVKASPNEVLSRDLANIKLRVLGFEPADGNWIEGDGRVWLRMPNEHSWEATWVRKET